MPDLASEKPHDGLRAEDDRKRHHGNALCLPRIRIWVGAGDAELFVATGHHLDRLKVRSAGLDVDIQAADL